MLSRLLFGLALLGASVAEAQTPPTPNYTAVHLVPQSGTPSPTQEGLCWTQTNQALFCYYNGAAHGPFITAGDIGLTVGTTPIASGTSGRVLYQNGSVLGELTNTALTALINSFSSSLSGAAPASGGGTTNFLRADGTWAAPAGTGVTTTGSPANGNLTKFSGASSITNGDLSGDVTTAGTLAATVAAINGAALGSTTATSGNLLLGSGTQWVTHAMSGDATITSGGAITLATVNSNVGSFGSGTQVATFTVNAKGLITAAANTAITGAPPSGAAGGDLSGSFPNPTVAKVNAVTYPSGPSANTVPVVTSATSGGTVTYEAVPNTALANSSLTIAGHAVSLGGSQALACGDLSNGATGCSTATGTSGATIPLLNGKNTWSASQAGSITTLAISTATFTPDGSNNHYAITLSHSACPCTLANPSPAFVAGTSGVITVTQSASGSDTIGTWGSVYEAPGGTATITLSTGANNVDVLAYFAIDTTHVLLVPNLNFSH